MRDVSRWATQGTRDTIGGYTPGPLHTRYTTPTDGFTRPIRTLSRRSPEAIQNVKERRMPAWKKHLRQSARGQKSLDAPTPFDHDKMVKLNKAGDAQGPSRISGFCRSADILFDKTVAIESDTRTEKAPAPIRQGVGRLSAFVVRHGTMRRVARDLRRVCAVRWRRYRTTPRFLMHTGSLPGWICRSYSGLTPDIRTATDQYTGRDALGLLSDLLSLLHARPRPCVQLALRRRSSLRD